MDMKLEGKRALVTGSSSGIGAEIARLLAREGAQVTVHGRNEQRARDVSEEITRAGGRAAAVVGDLSVDADAATVVGRAIDQMGGLDIVVNNAGGADKVPLTWETATLNDWRANFDQNFFSAVRVIREVLPTLKARGWGRVIQIATGWAMQPAPVAIDYAAGKAALVNATVSLSKGLAGTGVTVNTVSPGPILTPALERTARGLAAERGWGPDWEDVEREFVRHIVPNPTGRIGRVQDIATMVVFLASPLAGFINGANIRVDGGVVTSIN
jgi:NAD(P)-dependent dehydrogenase (short-subunit alcohol dehydrogenase family)